MMGSVDSTSGAGTGIDTLHARVHAGEIFDVDFIDETFTNAEVRNIGITALDGVSIHMRFGVSAGGDTRLQLYEDNTLSAGTPLTPQNANRESDKTTLVTFVNGPTVDVLGNLIREAILAGGTGGNANGFNLSPSQEIILKSNTQYLLGVKNVSGSSTVLSLNLQFYEVDAD